jgi:peptide/nickel transport system permease protein
LLRYILNKTGQVIFTLWVVSVIVFLLLRLSPGDPAMMMLPIEYTEEQYQRMRSALGLDEPLYTQYWKFISGVLHGDFGHSYMRASEALPLVLQRIPRTFALSVGALILGLLVAIPLGTIMALKSGGWLDRLGIAIVMISQSAPSFAVGILLILVFAVGLGILPAAGYEGPKYYILPCITLAILVMPIFSQMTRNCLIDAFQEDYIRTARAKGLTERRVIFKHAFIATLLSLVTMIGLQFGLLMAGSFIVEMVFAYPGMGQLMFESISLRDYPTVQATIMVSAFFFTVINLLVDLTYGLIDPRIRLRGSE